MNLKGQHIGKLFTLLAGLIILAHAVVPHHHHSEVTHSSKPESTCESLCKEKNTGTPYAHCHAFNLLVSEKSMNFLLNKTFSNDFSSFIPEITSNIEFLPVQNITSKFLEFKAIYLKPFFITANEMRGPPAIA